MLALLATSFEVVTWAKAKVVRDCHAQVQGSLYSVPWRYVGQTLDVRIGTAIVRFYAGAEFAKTHLRGRPGQRQTDWNDYPPEKAAFCQRTPAWCREQAARLGPHVCAAVEETARSSPSAPSAAKPRHHPPGRNAWRSAARCRLRAGTGVRQPAVPNDKDDPREGAGSTTVSRSGLVSFASDSAER